MLTKKTLITALILMALPQFVGAADLRAYRYTYDHGSAANSTSQDNQHLICDSCPPIPMPDKAGKEISLVEITKTIGFTDNGRRAPLEDWSASVGHEKLSGSMNVVAASHKVHFGFDSARLSGSETTQLGSFLASSLRKNGNSEIIVTGYTCDIGAKQYNLGLSQRRARAVEKVVAGLGYKGMKVDWKGVLPTTKSGRAENRRSDVVIKTR